MVKIITHGSSLQCRRRQFSSLCQCQPCADIQLVPIPTLLCKPEVTFPTSLYNSLLKVLIDSISTHHLGREIPVISTHCTDKDFLLYLLPFTLYLYPLVLESSAHGNSFTPLQIDHHLVHTNQILSQYQLLWTNILADSLISWVMLPICSIHSAQRNAISHGVNFL